MKAGAAGALALGLAACGSSGGSNSGTARGPSQSAGPPTGGKPVRGGVLTVAVVTSGAAETVNPMIAANVSDIMRVYALYDTPFRQGTDGAVEPGLVEHTSVSQDAKKWTWELRRDVIWHDGTPFTADDMVYTIQHMWGDRTNYFYAVMSTLIDFPNVRKRDKYTVEVPLKVGVAQFPSVTCNQQNVVVQNGWKPGSTPVGTGPYKFESFTPGKQSRFTANPHYWLGNGPYVDSLVVDSTFSSTQACLNALLAGQANIYPAVDPALAAVNAANGSIVLGNRSGPGFIGLVQRVDQGGALGNATVRKALKYIPDRPQYVSSAFNGYASVGNDLVGATDQFFASDLKHEHDPDRARALLKQAGHENLALTLKTAAAVPGMVEIATIFKQDALAADVKITVQQGSPTYYYTAAGGYLTRPFGTISYTTQVNSLASFYLSSLVRNAPFSDSHWGDPGAPAFGPDNSLLYEALAETDNTQAADKWHQVQQINFDEGPYVIPANTNWVDAYSPNVRGVQTSPALNCNVFDFSGAWLKK